MCRTRQHWVWSLLVGPQRIWLIALQRERVGPQEFPGVLRVLVGWPDLGQRVGSRPCRGVRVGRDEALPDGSLDERVDELHAAAQPAAPGLGWLVDSEVEAVEYTDGVVAVVG